MQRPLYRLPDDSSQ